MLITPVNPTGTSKDLGLAAAMVPGTTPPSNQNILWLDTTQNPNIKKYYDFGSGLWLPLIQGTNTPTSNGNTIDVGNQTIFVSINGNDFTGVPGNLALPFGTIVGAYAAAKALSPTYQNRITIAVFPGKYLEAATLDTDYISIIAAIQQETIFNDSLINTYTSYLNQRRRCIIDNTVTVTAKNVIVKGIDIKTLTLKSFPTSDTAIANNIFENMICGTINNNTFGNRITGLFFDVHADSFLQSDSLVDIVNSSFIMCGSTALRAGISTFSSGVWKGGVFNSFFDRCWGRVGSFSGNGGYAYQTSFFNCVGTNNCYGTLENCTIDKAVFGNTCVFLMNGGVLKNSTGGTSCVSDFTNAATIKDCDFGVNFGRSGTLTYLWGNLDNVKSDYTTTGFCNQRTWYGKMRRMFIRVDNAGKYALNVITPTIGGVLQQPSTIENSTLLACYADSTAPINGDVGYISYCKFNKVNSIINPLGTDAAAYNIVNTNFCNYVATTCALPTGFTYTSGALTTGAPITFTFSYQMSSTRAGSQILMIDPSGQSSIINFTGNSGGSTTGTLNVPVTSPIAGAYLFQLRTVCAYDGSGNAINFSAWTTPQLTGNVTVPVTRTTAWRAQSSSVFCVLTNLSPQPLYIKLSLRNPHVLTNYTPNPGAGNFNQVSQSNQSDLYAMFYTDAALTNPATLTNQNFVIYVREQASSLNYNYVGTSTSPSSTYTTYNESVLTYQLTNVSGTEYLLQANIATSTSSQETNDFSFTGTLRYTVTSTDVYQIFPNSTAVIGQTGLKGWHTLEQYYTDDSSLTGTTKVNISSDVNYVAPVSDTASCPIVAPITNISYGTSLIINKMQLTTGTNVVVPSHSTPHDSGSSGDSFVVQRFIGLPTALVVNVNTYYSGIVTVPGYVICTVTSDAGTQTFNLARGVQTNVGTFTNITQINLSDF